VKHLPPPTPQSARAAEDLLVRRQRATNRETDLAIVRDAAQLEAFACVTVSEG
jgi:hypothetical protein